MKEIVQFVCFIYPKLIFLVKYINVRVVMLIVERCVKPPGFVYSARTYKLVFDNNALYLLHIGRAMGPKVRANGYLADKLAQAMIQKMERKMMQQLADRENEIEGLNEELTKSKKSRRFDSNKEVELKFKKRTDGSGKLRVKGKGVNVGLEILPQDVRIVDQILANF